MNREIYVGEYLVIEEPGGGATVFGEDADYKAFDTFEEACEWAREQAEK